MDSEDKMASWDNTKNVSLDKVFGVYACNNLDADIERLLFCRHANILVIVLPAMMFQVYKKVKVIEEKQNALMEDVARIKGVLVKTAGEEHMDQFFTHEKFDDCTKFEEFCTKLAEDSNYRLMFVSTSDFPRLLNLNILLNTINLV